MSASEGSGIFAHSRAARIAATSERGSAAWKAAITPSKSGSLIAGAERGPLQVPCTTEADSKVLSRAE